jgi:hypothetical protein
VGPPPPLMVGGVQNAPLGRSGSLQRQQQLAYRHWFYSYSNPSDSESPSTIEAAWELVPATTSIDRLFVSIPWQQEGECCLRVPIGQEQERPENRIL